MNVTQQRRPNTRLIVVLVITVFAGTFGVGAWHSRQVRVSSKQLLDRGLAAQSAGNHRLAVAELGRYMKFAPRDVDAVAAYSDSLIQTGSTLQIREKVFSLNEDILRHRPDETKIRTAQAQLALDLERIPAAASYVDIIERTQPLTAALWHIRGRCFEANRRTDKAISSYESALRLDPNHVESIAQLAGLLATYKNDQQRADELLSSLVSRTGSVDALLLRARRSAGAGQSDRAISDLRAAVRMAPENSTAVCALAAAVHRAMSSNDTPPHEQLEPIRQESLRSLRTRIPADADNSPMRLYFARLLWLKESDRGEAITVLRTGHELEPGNSVLLFCLIDCLISDDKLNEAGLLLPRFGDEPDSRHQRQLLEARILMAGADWKQAAQSLGGLVKAVPRDQQLLSRARIYEAACLRELNQNSAAANGFQRTLKDNPESTVARLGLAESYLRNNEIRAAIREYQQLKTIPRVAAFLTDLLIEAQTTELAEARRWEEIGRLADPDSGSVRDPIERAILWADMQFAQGESKQAWTTLVELIAKNPDSQQAFQAIDHATSLLLDRLMERLAAGQYDPEANAGFAMVADYWSTRRDSGILAAYFEEPINSTGDRDRLLQRMTLSVFVVSRLAKHITQRGGNSSDLRQYADSLSARLVKADPRSLGQRLQMLQYLGQTERVFQEVQAAGSDVVGDAVSQIVPAFYGNSTGLNRLAAKVATELRSRPDSISLRNAAAMIQSARGNYEAALTAWRALHQQSPNNVIIARNLALLLAIHANDIEESSRVIANALRAEPNNAGLRHAGACIAIARGDLAEAQKSLEALSSASMSLSRLVHLAYTQATRSMPGKARYTLSRIYQSDLEDVALHPLDKVILKRLTDTLK